MMIRGHIRKYFILVTLILVMACGEVCGIRLASAATAANPIKLRMIVAGEPGGTGGPHGDMHGYTLTGETIVYNTMEPLVDLGKDGKPVPKLATKWEQRDSTIWRFYLRKGVKFHNGADFTARDVVEFAKWLNEVKDLSTTYQHVPIKQAVAVDDYTVDLVFEEPQPLLLIRGRGFLIPPMAITRDNREMLKTNPIGTGPYRIAEWKRGQYIKLAKFGGYWGPKPQIDEVEILFRAEEGVRLAALMAGEADWVYGLTSEQVSRAPKIVRMPSPETVWIRLDESVQKNPIFADKRLRLAVEYAIDRKALIALYGGLATPSMGQFASPSDFGFNFNLKNRPYDLEKAKTLVREAGAVGKTVSFVCAADRWPKSREAAEAVAYMIGQSGLKVNLMAMPKQETIKYWTTQGSSRQFMSDLHMHSTDTPLESESRYGIILVDGGKNSAISDPETKRLYGEVLAEPDYIKRGEKLAKAWAYAYEEVHCIPLFRLDTIWGLSKNLEWKPDITGRPFIADMRFTD